MAIKSLVLLTHSGSTTARKEVHTTGLVSLAIITDHIYNNTSIYIQNTLVQLSHDVQVNAPLIMHFTSILRTLHWLPIDYLNKFKRAVLIYARTGVSPRSVYIYLSLSCQHISSNHLARHTALLKLSTLRFATL